MTNKTIAGKLHIKSGSTLWSSHRDRTALIGPLPAGVREVSGPAEAAAALVFADDAGSLRRMLDEHKAHVAAPGVIWVAYPKGNRADINRDTLWPILAGYGLRPISQVTVDEVWSALRFRPLKPGEAPFTGGRSPRAAPTSMVSCPNQSGLPSVARAANDPAERATLLEPARIGRWLVDAAIRNCTAASRQTPVN